MRRVPESLAAIGCKWTSALPVNARTPGALHVPRQAMLHWRAKFCVICFDYFWSILWVTKLTKLSFSDRLLWALEHTEDIFWANDVALGAYSYAPHFLEMFYMSMILHKFEIQWKSLHSLEGLLRITFHIPPTVSSFLAWDQLQNCTLHFPLPTASSLETGLCYVYSYSLCCHSENKLKNNVVLWYQTYFSTQIKLSDQLRALQKQCFSSKNWIKSLKKN